MSPTKATTGSNPSCQAARLGEFFNNLTDFLAKLLSRYQLGFLALASAAYFTLTCYSAGRKLFWYDEIPTYYIAQLPDLASLWMACKQLFSPPLFYLVTRWSQQLVGANELGTRLPAILGFWLFCISLYRFVAKRTNPIAGFISLLYPLTTGGYWYAFEARPHGVLVGLFGVALISWQEVTDGNSGVLALPCLTTSLTAAMLLHGYAFLLLFPLVFGELTRSFLNKHWNPMIWFSLTSPAVLSAVTVLPMLHGIHDSVAPAFLKHAPFQRVWTAWELSFKPSFTLAILLVLLIPGILPQLNLALPGVRKAEVPNWGFSLPEIAVLFCIFCTPLVAYVASRVAYAPFFARYSLILVGGASCLIALTAARSNRTGLLVLLLIVLFIGHSAAMFYRGRVIREPSSGVEVDTRLTAESNRFKWIESAASGTDPIVLLDALASVPMLHYAPPSLVSRFVFLVPDDLVDLYMPLQKCCRVPGRVFSRSEFVTAHHTFFVYGSADSLFHQEDYFRRLGAQVTNQSCGSEGCVLRVESE
jgi:4-amino-4-deoxy-L-arabinose transferase-like glycosyltransferase